MEDEPLHPLPESESLESLPLELVSPPHPSPDESLESPPHPSLESAATCAAPAPRSTAAPLLVPWFEGEPPPLVAPCGGAAGVDASHACA